MFEPKDVLAVLLDAMLCDATLCAVTTWITPKYLKSRWIMEIKSPKAKDWR
jgi:hypothetical protein